MNVSLYELSDPREPGPRYIGVTVKPLSHRLHRHLAEAKAGAECHRANWIRALVRDGVKPQIRLIESVDRAHAAQREVEVIAAYRALGHRLTNNTIGGDGVRGLGEESRRRGAERRTGQKRTPEQCARIGAGHLGKTLTPEQRRRISEALRASTKKKRGQKPRPRMSSDELALSKAVASERRSASLRAFYAANPEVIERKRQRKGWRHSEEAKALMSVARRARIDQVLP